MRNVDIITRHLDRAIERGGFRIDEVMEITDSLFAIRQQIAELKGIKQKQIPPNLKLHDDPPGL